MPGSRKDGRRTTAVDGRSLLAEAEAGERSSSVRRSPAASPPIAWQDARTGAPSPLSSPRGDKISIVSNQQVENSLPQIKIPHHTLPCGHWTSSFSRGDKISIVSLCGNKISIVSNQQVENSLPQIKIPHHTLPCGHWTSSFSRGDKISIVSLCGNRISSCRRHVQVENLHPRVENLHPQEACQANIGTMPMVRVETQWPTQPCSRCTSTIATSAGVMPRTRPACPRVCGWMRSSCSRASARRCRTLA